MVQPSLACYPKDKRIYDLAREYPIYCFFLRFTFILQKMWTPLWKYGHGCYNDNISNIITNPLEMWSIDYYKKCTVLYVATECFLSLMGNGCVHLYTPIEIFTHIKINTRSQKVRAWSQNLASRSCSQIPEKENKTTNVRSSPLHLKEISPVSRHHMSHRTQTFWEGPCLKNLA